MFIIILGIIWVITFCHIIYSIILLVRKRKFIMHLHAYKHTNNNEHIVERRKNNENSFEQEQKRIASLSIAERKRMRDKWLDDEELKIRLDKQWMDQLRDAVQDIICIK